MRKKEPPFEQLYQELELTVQKLEEGNLSLDESLLLYERGMELARRCGEQLDRAELRITELAPPPSRLGDDLLEAQTPEEDSD